LFELNPWEIKQKSNNLWKIYQTDFDREDLQTELLHLKEHLIIKFGPETLSPLKLIQFIYENELKIVYPNVEIVLRIFVSTPATNCSAERSFSCLKRIKNYQRSTMSQQRLNALAILCIENQITANIEYEDIIKSFAEQKSRRKILI